MNRHDSDSRMTAASQRLEVGDGPKAYEGVVATILLAGDAGDLGDMVGATLKYHAAIRPSSTTVFYLGDNIYPMGLPSEDDQGYQNARERIDRQVMVLKGSAVRGLFFPGNHDWQRSGPNGWEWVKRQQALVERELGAGSYLPGGGCPGPVEALETEYAQVVVVDSEWFLRSYAKPSASSDGCPTWTEEMVMAELRRLLTKKIRSATRIFLQHHPIESVGEHSHGSRCPQDFGCPSYDHMRLTELAALDVGRPLLCAAGHDHSLQVLTGSRGCEYFAVSGSMSSASDVLTDGRTLFAQSRLGFMRLDFLAGGKVRLRSVVVESGHPEGKVVFEKWLRE